MNKKKIIVCLGLLIILIDVFILIFGNEIPSSNCFLIFRLKSENNLDFQVFYSESKEMFPEQSQTIKYNKNFGLKEMKFEIDPHTKFIRLDFGSETGEFLLSDFKLQYKNQELPININTILSKVVQINMIDNKNIINNQLLVKTSGSDPYVLIDLEDLQINEWISNYIAVNVKKEKLIICVIIDIILISIYFFATKLFVLPKELYNNKRLIFNLAKNDFKTKYAGSYFGIFWAFVQPVVTILLYWFVFQVGLRAGNVNEYPFVLWLIAGLIPWFYFYDAFNYGTNALLEYSYLVKKVVFNINILPIVKNISALFIHIFFLLFVFIIFAILGYPPTIFSIQILYYTFCIFMLTLSLTYCTSAVILFFRDLGQIINIILQIGIWLTPIMWSDEMIPNSFKWVLSINPMYYIVRGYRDALLDKVWFMERLADTFYFWLTVGAIFIFGMFVFKRLRSHFADVI